MLRLAAVAAILCWVGAISPAAGQAAQAASPALQEDPPRPGDVIRLRVWREPDLSGEFTVDEKGEVVLPRIGPLRVTADPPRVLEQKLVQAYARFLTHSSIDVTLLRRIQVLGAVRNPGLYPVDATMSIADALALAGGATTEGRPDRVELVRDGKRIATKLSGNTKIAGARIRSGDQLFVPERGWISRNSGIVAAALTASASLIIALFTR